MRHFALALAVLSSLLVGLSSAATRPHYGGTLRIKMRAALTSLDPADERTAEQVALAHISALILDTLVSLDDSAKPQPSLALSWRSELGDHRWTFDLRAGARLQNGSLLTPDTVAASLRSSNPGWKVTADGSTVSVESDNPLPDLPAILALPRNSIAVRTGSSLLGTGPFAIAEWLPGKMLTLSARDDSWHGRPFVDSIEIEMGRKLHDQMIALDLGKADLIELPPEQVHRAMVVGPRLATSTPLILIALVFRREPTSEDDKKLRRALSLSINRKSLNSVVLQAGGEPAASLLPNWLTGYAFVFSTTPELRQARELRDSVREMPTWSLSYDREDPVARLLAERIALNARDAGLSLQPTVASISDIQLLSIPLESVSARTALNAIATRTAMDLRGSSGKSLEDLYQAEITLLASQRVIPLLHVRVNYGLSPTLKNFAQHSNGSWDLGGVWLGAAKP